MILVDLMIFLGTTGSSITTGAIYSMGAIEGLFPLLRLPFSGCVGDASVGDASVGRQSSSTSIGSSSCTVGST